MSSMKIPAVKLPEWGVRTVTLEMAEDFNWGINPVYTPVIIKILEREGRYTPTGDETMINFTMVRALVKYLYDNKINTSNLPAAVESMIKGKGGHESSSLL